MVAGGTESLRTLALVWIVKQFDKIIIHPQTNRIVRRFMAHGGRNQDCLKK
jgi:hypothetical protein